MEVDDALTIINAVIVATLLVISVFAILYSLNSDDEPKDNE